MKIFTRALVPLIMIAVAQSAAADCEAVGDADARLACFDARAQCAGIEDPAARLRCYEDPVATMAGPVRPDDRRAQPGPDAEANARPPRSETAAPGSRHGSPAVATADARRPARPAARDDDASGVGAGAGSESVSVSGSGSGAGAGQDAVDPAFAVKGRGRAQEGREAREEATRPELAAVIDEVRTDPRGIVYLFLDNGQVWRETARSRHPYASGMGVTLTTGMLGSTNLTADGMRRYAKVRRVR